MAATAHVWIVCGKCGRRFERQKMCRSQNAAGKYEDWVYKNMTLCPKCWFNAKREDELKERAEKEKRDEEITRGVKFSAFVFGSEKQIAWAEKIRRGAVASLLADKRGLSEDTLAHINAITDSRWWISIRDRMRTPGMFLDEMRQYFRRNPSDAPAINVEMEGDKPCGKSSRQ